METETRIVIDDTPVFDLCEFRDAIKAALAERFPEVSVHCEPDVGDWRMVWWFTGAADAPTAIKVRVTRERESGRVAGSIWRSGPPPFSSSPALASMEANAADPGSIVGLLCTKLIDRAGIGKINGDVLKSVVAAVKLGSMFCDRVAAALRKPVNSASLIDGAVAAGFTAPAEAATRIRPPADDGLKHDMTPSATRLIKATPVNTRPVECKRPSLLAAARKAGVAAPPPDPAPVLDADGGREIPAPVGFKSPAELRRLGARPLVTCDDGPTAGWGTYDPDEL